MSTTSHNEDRASDVIRVLVVDDSPTKRAWLTGLLEEEPGFRVIGQAANGEQAVELTGCLTPDLITMDVVMPDMDGLEATRRIMALRPTPIVMVTSHADTPETNIVFDAMKAGAVEVFGRPLHMDEETVKHWGEQLMTTLKDLMESCPQSLV